MNSASIRQSLEPPQQQVNSAAVERSDAYRLDIVRSLQMHRTLAIAVAVVAFAIVFAYGLSRQPYYETEAYIYVQPVKAKLVTDPTEGTYDSPRYDTYIQQQLLTIVRPDILAQALNQPSTKAWRFPGESDQAAILRLQKSLKVERDMNSYQLTVSLSGSDPKAITDVLNAVCDAYIHGERSDELAQSDQQLKILQGERERLSADLAQSRQEQAKLSTELGVADTTGDTGNPYDVQLAELRSELAKATAAHDVAEIQLASVSNRNASSSETLRSAAEELAASDPGLAALRQRIGERRGELARQMAGLKQNNPIYKQDQEEIRQLQLSLDTMSAELHAKAARQLQQKLAAEARRTADVEARLTSVLAEKSAAASRAAPQLQRAKELDADITRLQGRYTEVDNTINALELEKNTAGLVHLLVPAVPPAKPKTSAKWLILAGALPFGLGLGTIAAVVRKKFDPRIYIGEDIGRILHFHPMAILPDAADVDSSVSNEFLFRLVAGIDQAHRADGSRTFVFTAASSGSAIGDTVAHLALQMERLGYEVAILKAAALIQSPPGGTPPARPADAVRENYAVQTIETINRSSDLLFIEAMPLLSSSESEFAARLSDVVVLVVESARTTDTELANALALVKRLRIPGAAVVLCDLSLAHADKEFLDAVRSAELRPQNA